LGVRDGGNPRVASLPSARQDAEERSSRTYRTSATRRSRRPRERPASMVATSLALGVSTREKVQPDKAAGIQPHFFPSSVQTRAIEDAYRDVRCFLMFKEASLYGIPDAPCVKPVNSYSQHAKARVAGEQQDVCLAMLSELVSYWQHSRGGMCERLKQAVLKTALPERVTGVRIPLPPPGTLPGSSIASPKFPRPHLKIC
jgi:hypothetical protein